MIESKSKLDINKKTPNPTEYNVSIPVSGTSGYEYNIFGRWGVMVNENLTLHVERNKKSYEHVLVTAYKNSTDEEAHVITLGNLPDNTRYPGLVNIGNNQILMFGGFYVWNNEEDESYGVSDEMFLITVEEITWYDGVNDIPIVQTSWVKPEVDGNPPSGRANPIMAYDGNKKVYMMGGWKLNGGNTNLFDPVDDSTETMKVWDLNMEIILNPVEAEVKPEKIGSGMNYLR